MKMSMHTGPHAWHTTLCPHRLFPGTLGDNGTGVLSVFGAGTLSHTDGRMSHLDGGMLSHLGGGILSRSLRHSDAVASQFPFAILALAPQFIKRFIQLLLNIGRMCMSNRQLALELRNLGFKLTLCFGIARQLLDKPVELSHHTACVLFKSHQTLTGALDLVFDIGHGCSAPCLHEDLGLN